MSAKAEAQERWQAAKKENMTSQQPKNVSGEVELRGLDAGKTYKVTDYVNQKDYGTVTGPTAKSRSDFTGNLLLEAAPGSKHATTVTSACVDRKETSARQDALRGSG